jgi:hypothetical protein
MASNVTIGNLVTLTTVSDSTVFASEDSGLTRKVSAAVLKNYMSSMSAVVTTGLFTAAGGISSNTIQAATIGNTGTILIGTLSSDYQPNITGLGTLANLTIAGNLSVSGNATINGNVNLSGNLVSNNVAAFAAINNTVIGNVSHATGRFTTVTASTVTAGTLGNLGAVLTGTLSTAAQTNITSVGTLTSLAVTGNITAGNVSATKGTFTQIAGTLLTAAQTNITSVGTLDSLSVTGNITAGNISATKGTFTQIAGTLLTAAQTNITSIGTLSTLTVSGQTTVGNVITTNGVFWANGSTYSSGTGGASFTNIASNVTPSANLTYNLGSTTAYWNNVYGKAVQAQYADLAENYTSVHNYSPGTVVAWNTSDLIDETLMMAQTSHTPWVAGVISTNPAYLMNSDAPGLPLALSGRVPCKALGPITKGDRLAVVAPGTAGRLDPQLYQPGCVIGYALASVPDGELTTIEVVIMKF